MLTYIKSVKKLGKKKIVGITTEKNHNYFVQGVLTGNSHAVSYSLLTQYTLYLKTYYPLYFYASCLKYSSSAENKEETIVEMRKNGIELELPNINISEPKDFVIDKKNKRIYYSLSEIKGLGEKPSEIISSLKPYKSFQDFLFKVKDKRREINKNKILCLIYCNAFRDFSINIKALEETFKEVNEDNKKILLTDKILKDKEQYIKDYSDYEKQLFKQQYLNYQENLLHILLTEKNIKTLEQDPEIVTNFELIDFELPKYYIFYIKDMFERVDKKNGLMCFIEAIDYYNNSIKIVIFSKDYIKIKDKIKINCGYMAKCVGNKYKDTISLVLQKEIVKL